MIQPLEILIKYLEGKWISQQTIYDFANKIININQSEIIYSPLKQVESINYGYTCEYLNNKKIIYHYINYNNSYPLEGKIEKLDQKIVTNYFFKLENESFLKVDCLNNNIKYTEYIYFFHKNFKLSIIVIKKIKQYNAICFISNIKIE
uniref:hypothetical protein n=1 Tax=Caulacanthus ustulatus TaxID=31411 RepID=UPI0027DA0F13|nr:hypothetical protein REQ00_pgp119 [Caulacanthus ustulatus]WCH57306.1 hypothetical protein [Caulacanthus ustulatus]